jgi:hypothetical protein
MQRTTQQDPLKRLEVESLLGYQKGVSFSFTTENNGNKERLEVMEEVDVNKKAIKWRANGDP